MDVKANVLQRFGKGVAAIVTALALSVMMVPATAFAANDVNMVNADATSKDVSVEVGDVSTNGNPGVTVTADNGHTATVKTGNITADSGLGVKADATGLGTIEVTTGDIESTSESGVQARVKGDGTISVNAGDIASGYQSAGIWTSVDNDTIVKDGSISVKAGDVNAQAEGVVIRSYAQSGITVEIGNVTARENGVEFVVEQGAKGAISANDITSDKSGMFVYVNEGSQIDALVTGTLSGKKAPISFFGAWGNLPDNVKLTVWRIAFGDGPIAMQASPAEGMMAQAVPSDDASEGDVPADFRGWVVSPFARSDAGSEFEKSILYIMKLDQPEEGATLSATYADGTKLETSHDFSVAREGETVRLKVSLQEGFELLGAFDGNGDKVELVKGEDGFYYIDYKVPKGGGIGLSVLLNGPSDGIVLADEEPVATKAVSANAGSGATLPKTGDNAFALVLFALSLLSALTLVRAGVYVFERK